MDEVVAVGGAGGRQGSRGSGGQWGLEAGRVAVTVAGRGGLTVARG